MLIISAQTSQSLGPATRGRAAVIFVQAQMTGISPIRFVATSDPAEALREIDRHLPVETFLVGWMPHDSPRQLVNALATEYKAANIRGDWYQPTPAVSAYILHVAQPPLAELLAQLPGHSHPDGTVTIEEMAQLLGVSVSTLRRRVDDGTIPVLRFGRVLRFVPADVFASIRSRG